jgi:hypothetical protein
VARATGGCGGCDRCYRAINVCGIAVPQLVHHLLLALRDRLRVLRVERRDGDTDQPVDDRHDVAAVLALGVFLVRGAVGASFMQMRMRLKLSPNGPCRP